MKPNRLMVQMALWGACLAAFNLAIREVSRSSIPRQVARSIDATPPVTDLFAGNSLVAAAVDAREFDLAHPGRHALNIAMGFSDATEHNILIRRSLKKLRPRRVYYGFFDRQLIGRSKGGWADLVGNRAMAYYMDLDLAIRFYAAADPFRAARMRVVSRVPMLVERYAIWAKVEKLRRRFARIGLQKQAVNRFGRADDFRFLESSDSAKFLAACRRAVDERAEFSPPIADMFRLLREREIALVVVEMPMTSLHRRRFYDHPQWREARRYFAEQVRRSGGTYVDASSWIADDLFADSLHLSPEGAAEFSRRIGDETTAQGQ